MLVPVLLSVAATLLTTWLLLVITLLVMRARGIPVTEGLRLLPDVLRLLRGLAPDRTLPWTVRARVWVALAWLISPIDLIPEFLPVIGAVDDVIVVAIALRSLIRRAGPGTVQRHWRGTPHGLAAVSRLCRLPIPPPGPPPAR